MGNILVQFASCSITQMFWASWRRTRYAPAILLCDTGCWNQYKVKDMYNDTTEDEGKICKPNPSKKGSRHHPTLITHTISYHYFTLKVFGRFWHLSLYVASHRTSMVSECFKIPARLKMPAVFSSSETAREATKQCVARMKQEWNVRKATSMATMPAPSQVAYMFYQLTTSRWLDHQHSVTLFPIIMVKWKTGVLERQRSSRSLGKTAICLHWKLDHGTSRKTSHLQQDMSVRGNQHIPTYSIHLNGFCI